VRRGEPTTTQPPMTRNTDADDTTDADGEIERLIEADADGAGVDQ